MSNQVVGSVYQQIIDKVIQVSQNDFEEFGVDHSTLEEMKQGWQEKLSALRVATFPWDPQPEPVRQPPTVPSNVKNEVDAAHAGATQEQVNFPNVPVKVEPTFQQPLANYPQAQAANGSTYTGGYDQNINIAQQRAHALVAQRVHQAGLSNTAQQTHSPQMPAQGQQQRLMAAQQHQRVPQLPAQRPSQGHVYNASQTDGASDTLVDWAALRASEESMPRDSRIYADAFMRARVDALAMRQDNGLMMPLASQRKGKRREAAIRVLLSERVKSSSASGIARFDGDDDVKEEDPDDAINSDLDDPEDDLGDGDNSDEEMVDYMLCTYDKVQRVKNKWKCTLKDGILTTNKKEYLFHKATAELDF